MKSQVSVIIPSYNRADTLPKAVESVLLQSSVEVEVIIIDDGSTDSTESDAKELLDFWGSSVKYFRQPNLERSRARNNGIRLSKFNLVAFLDSDDIWLPNHLETCVEIITQNPGIIGAFSDFEYIDRQIKQNRSKLHKTHFDSVEFSKRLCVMDALIHPSRLVLDRSAVENILFDERIPGCEDWVLIAQLLTKGQILPTNKSTVLMRQSLDGTFGQTDKFKKSVELAARLIIDSGLPGLVSVPAWRVLATGKLQCAYVDYLAGNKLSGVLNLLESIRVNAKVVIWRRFWIVLIRLLIPKRATTTLRKLARKQYGLAKGNSL